jgi:hypothetical protein
VTKDIILEAVEHKYLLKIEDKILGFLNQTPNDMLTHLQNRGGHCYQKEMENGMQAKHHRYISTESKKQSRDLPVQASHLT